MAWCPYTDEDLDVGGTTPEHIIPLSLGGSNLFCIPVDADYNSRVAAKIDAAVANDFLVSFRRRAFGTAGHSGKEPSVILRNSKLTDSGNPIHVTLRGEELPIIFDHKSRKILEDKDMLGKKFVSQLKFEHLAYIKFTAKVALSAGYYIYGEIFRNCVAHHELRLLMNYSYGNSESPFSSGHLRVYDKFCEVKESDRVECDTHKFMCSTVNGSCVLVIPCTENVIFIVGVLGEWIGTVNIAADTKSFPLDGEHDLGHAVILEDKKKVTLSYREFARRMLPLLSKMKK